MPNQKNPWEKINEKPPKFEIGDIVYTYLTVGDEYNNVVARQVPKENILYLCKAVVIGYVLEKHEWDGIETPFPCYVVKTLEIYFDHANVEEVGLEHSVNRFWVEQADDVYKKFFGKRPSHVEFVFR